MRGPSKTPPKYRKHKKSGQAVVTLDGLASAMFALGYAESVDVDVVPAKRVEVGFSPR